MDPDKRRRLEAKGYVVGSVAEVLRLTPAEAAKVEVLVVRDRIAEAIRRLRSARGLSQSEAGALAGLSQQQVAKVEKEAARSGSGGTSVDLMLRLLFALGGTLADLQALPDAVTESVSIKSPRRPAEVG